MVDRRRFLFLGAAASAVTTASATPSLEAVKTRRVGNVEIAFKSPSGSKPNGLQATKDGLWIMDQGEGNKAYLVSYKDGKVLRSFGTETDRSSGITVDDCTLWIGSTYSREIVRCDAVTGKTLEKHFTPGAGVIYQMVGDPPARSSPLAAKSPPDQHKTPGQNANPKDVGGFQAGQLLGSRALGTGAHGQEVKRRQALDGGAPGAHGVLPESKNLGRREALCHSGKSPARHWLGGIFWVTDSNWNAFLKHDPETGDIVEKIQLADSDPLPHGMSIWKERSGIATMWA